MQSQVPIQPGMMIPNNGMFAQQQQMPYGFPAPGMIPQQQMRPGMPGMFAPQQHPGMYAPNQAAMLLDPFAMMNLNRPYNQGGAHNTAGNKQKRKERMNELPSLYISNLPKENFFDLDFYKFFTNKGYKVKNAKVVIDSKTNKSRGYGYLQFVN